MLEQNKMSFENYRFWISDCDGTYSVSSKDMLIQEMHAEIEYAMSKGQRFIEPKELVYGSCEVIRIEWR